MSAAVTAFGCSKARSEGATGEASASVSAGAAPSSSQPLVVQCYQGCLDINKGKPVDQAEIDHACEERCVKICTKSCVARAPDAGPPDETKKTCADGCNASLKGRR